MGLTLEEMMKKNKKPRSKKRISFGQLAAREIENGNFAKAEEYYRILLKEHPNNTSLLAVLGKTFIDQQKYEEAIPVLERVVQTDSYDAGVAYNLALSHHQLSHQVEAIQFYEKAIDLNPNLFGAHNNLGVIYLLKRNYAKVKHHLSAAMHINPTDARVLVNLALACADSGDIQAAQETLLQAINLDPNNDVSYSNYLMNMHYFSSLDREKVFDAHRQWNSRYAVPKAQRLLQKNIKNPDRKLRIGYISPDFRIHSVAYFFIPIIKSHNKNEFEIFCYSDTNSPDGMTHHISSLCDTWRDVYLLSHEDLCTQIQKDGIDILVELSGHTGGNRLRALSYKPAPVQVSYLGYPNTTGVEAIDYRITDHWADPVGETDHLHTEKLIRLENGFLCYQAASDIGEPSPAPHLNNGYITFGSFNTLHKVNDAVIDIWARLLKIVPNSRLALKALGLKDKSTQTYLLEKFVKHGIEKDRIILLQATDSMFDHLACYSQVDIALDTFPYNGTTTTCEALWMGVPVVTVKGDCHVARVGYSIMGQGGLTEMVANNYDEYLSIAMELAENSALLSHLRSNLRPHIQNSALTHAPLHTQEMEFEYRKIWADYCVTATKDSKIEA